MPLTIIKITKEEKKQLDILHKAIPSKNHVSYMIKVGDYVSFLMELETRWGYRGAWDDKDGPNDDYPDQWP